MKVGQRKPPKRNGGNGGGYVDNTVTLFCGHQVLFGAGVPAPQKGDYVFCFRCDQTQGVQKTANQWVAECLDCDLRGEGDSWGERLHTCKSGIAHLMESHHQETGHSNMRFILIRHSGALQQGKEAQWRYWTGPKEWAQYKPKG